VQKIPSFQAAARWQFRCERSDERPSSAAVSPLCASRLSSTARIASLRGKTSPEKKTQQFMSDASQQTKTLKQD